MLKPATTNPNNPTFRFSQITADNPAIQHISARTDDFDTKDTEDTISTSDSELGHDFTKQSPRTSNFLLESYPHLRQSRGRSLSAKPRTIFVSGHSRIFSLISSFDGFLRMGQLHMLTGLYLHVELRPSLSWAEIAGTQNLTPLTTMIRTSQQPPTSYLKSPKRYPQIHLWTLLLP